MSNVDLLLDGVLNNGNIILEIDEYNRSIKYDGNLLLGVEGDYKAEKVIFESPKTLSDDIDLTNNNVKIYINYENANGDVHIHRCEKDIKESEKVNIYWTLSGKVTEFPGKVRFMVCVKQFDSSNKIVNEWHTSIYEGIVLDGLNIDNHTQVTDPDLSVSINDLKYEVESLQNKLMDLSNNGFTLDDVFAKLNDIERNSVTHSHDSDDIRYTNAADQSKEGLTETLDDIYVKLKLLEGDTGQVIDVYTKTETDALLESRADAMHIHSTDDITYKGNMLTTKLKECVEDIWINDDKPNTLYCKKDGNDYTCNFSPSVYEHNIGFGASNYQDSNTGDLYGFDVTFTVTTTNSTEYTATQGVTQLVSTLTQLTSTVGAGKSFHASGGIRIGKGYIGIVKKIGLYNDSVIIVYDKFDLTNGYYFPNQTETLKHSAFTSGQYSGAIRDSSRKVSLI